MARSDIAAPFALTNESGRHIAWAGVLSISWCAAAASSMADTAAVQSHSRSFTIWLLLSGSLESGLAWV